MLTPVRIERELERLKAQAEAAEQKGDGVKGISTAFPKNPPPAGMAYSRNFARFHKDGRFAVQER